MYALRGCLGCARQHYCEAMEDHYPAAGRVWMYDLPGQSPMWLCDVHAPRVPHSLYDVDAAPSSYPCVAGDCGKATSNVVHMPSRGLFDLGRSDTERVWAHVCNAHRPLGAVSGSAPTASSEDLRVAAIEADAGDAKEFLSVWRVREFKATPSREHFQAVLDHLACGDGAKSKRAMLAVYDAIVAATSEADKANVLYKLLLACGHARSDAERWAEAAAAGEVDHYDCHENCHDDCMNADEALYLGDLTQDQRTALRALVASIS